MSIYSPQEEAKLAELKADVEKWDTELRGARDRADRPAEFVLKKTLQHALMLYNAALDKHPSNIQQP